MGWIRDGSYKNGREFHEQETSWFLARKIPCQDNQSKSWQHSFVLLVHSHKSGDVCICLLFLVIFIDGLPLSLQIVCIRIEKNHQWYPSICNVRPWRTSSDADWWLRWFLTQHPTWQALHDFEYQKRSNRHLATALAVRPPSKYDPNQRTTSVYIIRS